MTTRIGVRAGGPLVVEGDFELRGPRGDVVEPPRPGKVLICRCGRSKHGVLCDGSHNATDFEAELREQLRQTADE